ncbi:MAG: hypothetical protein ACRDRF_00720 [Pseudonocardiaceae bacterium]
MGKINRDEYRQNSDQLSGDDIEEAAILTVKEFANGDRTDKTGKWALLKFEETTDKILFLTDGALDAMIHHYGDDSDDWTGKSVAVEQYKKKDKTMGVRMMPTEQWEEAFKEAGVKYPRPAQKAARPATRAAVAKPGSRRR